MREKVLNLVSLLALRWSWHCSCHNALPPMTMTASRVARLSYARQCFIERPARRLVSAVVNRPITR